MATSTNLRAFGSVAHFAGLDAADFDAYARKKWRSNAFTLGRRTAKDKLLALTRAAQDALQDSLSDLELGASDEAPSVANGREVKEQLVYFIRPAEHRAALKTLLNRTDLGAGAGLFDIAIEHQHAHLFLRLDLDGLGVGVALPAKASVDRDNLARRLEYEGEADPLLAACAALPEGSQVSCCDDSLPAAELTEPQLDAWGKLLKDQPQSLSFECFFSREDPRLADAEEGGDPEAFVALVVDALARFLPVLRYLAWSPDNDFAHVKFTVKQVEKAKAEAKAEVAPPSLQAGGRVIILSGLFAGRAGYLGEVERGKAKVMVGPVAVSVDLSDLKPA